MPTPTPDNPKPNFPVLPVQNVALGAPARIVVTHRGVGRWLWWLGWVAFLIVLFMLIQTNAAYKSYLQADSPIQEHFHSLAKDGTDKVAIISVEGVIATADGFVKSQIDRVHDDKDVKAVVLRVNSPGGTVNGADGIYHQLLKLTEERKIPLVVSMGGIAASGGYYIAMAAGGQPDTIYCEPTTWTGSIGVIIPHYDLADLLEAWHVQDDSIVSHPLKQLGSPTKKFSPELKAEETAILQGLVNDAFTEFKSVVHAGRPAFTDDKIKEVATGQVFSAKQALANGLVDQQGYLDDAIERAIVLAKLDKAKTRVVAYQPPPGLASLLGVNAEARAPGGEINLSALLDLATPRAYYLWSFLPTAVTN